MRITGKLFAASAIVCAVAVLAPNSAYAGTGGGAVAVVGGGTINPPLLPTTPQNTTASFGGQAVGAFAAVDTAGTVKAGANAGAMTCSFQATSVGREISAKGQGTAAGTCNGTSVGGTTTLSCSRLAYTRDGALVVITAGVTQTTVDADGTVRNITSTNCTVTTTATVGGGTVSASVTGGGVFLFIPTQASPTGTYQLAGAAVGAG